VRVRLPQMIQDPTLLNRDVDRLVEDWTMLDEDHYLDGPITPRVAVVDLDPNTEKLEPGAVYRLPTGGQTLSRYDVDRDDVASRQFIQVSVFATVYRTMYLFEQKKTLGRKISWAFNGPQLLVVPRAGWLANAYYERRSHSLQFFSFMAGDTLVHTSLSRDIVAHETAHALIDGIDADLYDALDPQSLALHEGVADLTAMLMAFSSKRLRESILKNTKGSIETSTDFSSIGEQFGAAIDPTGKAGWLRSLLNEDALNPDGDPADEPEEHELSQVISGVLYKFMCALHDHFRKDVAKRFGQTEFSASGRALYVAARQFERMVLRGLDYLPPGEVTFADFGRAILAADQGSYDDETWRVWLRTAFAQRGIVKNERDLDVRTNFENEAVAKADFQGLVDSDWVAYTFAEANRELLGIPGDAQFEVLPRIVVDGRFESPDATMDRVTGDRDEAPGEAPGEATPQAEDGDGTGFADAEQGGVPFRELLFKVRWSHVEDNPPDLGAGQRRVQTGTTLVIDWNAKRIRSLLEPLSLKARSRARDTMLRRLVESGVIQVIETDPTARTKAAATGIDAVVTDGILRVRNTARLLHIVKELDE
jgi:hypothetical protein